jgi:anhydro-N-acetylmuramic acid kinase
LGEKLLFPEFRFFLNLGGIANISAHTPDHIIAFDVCPANRVLNMLANEQGHEYDEDGIMASFGQFNVDLYSELNALEYYRLPFPKSLSNDFGVDVIFPLIKIYGISIENALNTYVEHVAIQIKNSLNQFSQKKSQDILITGGGAFNKFLIKRLSIHLNEINFKIVLPATEVIQYKEALIMAFLGVLRWREQYTISASVTGALRNSIGGALWLGIEAKSD